MPSEGTPIAERVKSQLYLQREGRKQRRNRGSLVVNCKSSVFPHRHPTGSLALPAGEGWGRGERRGWEAPGAKPSFFTNPDVLASFQGLKQQQDQLLKQFFLHQHEPADHTVSASRAGWAHGYGIRLCWHPQNHEQIPFPTREGPESLQTK